MKRWPFGLCVFGMTLWLGIGAAWLSSYVARPEVYNNSFSRDIDIEPGIEVLDVDITITDNQFIYFIDASHYALSGDGSRANPFRIDSKALCQNIGDKVTKGAVEVVGENYWYHPSTPIIFPKGGRFAKGVYQVWFDVTDWCGGPTVNFDGDCR